MLLAAGAVLNLAVAWGCVLSHGPLGPKAALIQNPIDGLPRIFRITSQVGQETVSPFWWTAIGEDDPRVGTYRGRVWWPRGERFWNRSIHVQANGWPCFTLLGWWAAETETSADGEEGVMTYDTPWAIVIDRDWFGRSAGGGVNDVLFPLRPMWRGAVGNTLFYGCILCLLWFGVAALRRATRRRRGLCVRCAYPIGDSERCSECGTPVPARRPTAG